MGEVPGYAYTLESLQTLEPLQTNVMIELHIPKKEGKNENRNILF